MTQQPVFIPEFDPAHEQPFGPARIEHRTAASGLTELGTYFMVFDSDGLADPWTLRYEETIYVIEGEARIITSDGTSDDDGDDTSISDGTSDDTGSSDGTSDGDGRRTVVGVVGDLIVLRKGARVQYGGTAGTRLLLSISPVDWRTKST